MNEENIVLLNTSSPAILDQERHLAMVLENTATAFLLFDSESHLLFANSAGQNLFDDYEARVGQSLPVDSGDASLQQLLDKARHSQRPLKEEVVWPDKRIFSAEISPVQADSYVVTLYDVSRFKEREKQKDEFLAAAVHDLRNPITSIIGFNQLIKVTGGLNTSQNDFVQRIQHAATNMSELLENILELTKFDLDAESRKNEVDISHVLFETADEFQPQATLKRQLLVFEKIETQIILPGNESQLHQALRNLIGNAVKYTPEGGAITLSLELESNIAKIKVKDTGYGIPASEIPHIFERFYRAHNNGHDAIEGNGLGLAIVKSVAEKHGGEVTVESEVGKGSCFTLILPVSVPVDIKQISYEESKEV